MSQLAPAGAWFKRSQWFKLVLLVVLTLTSVTMAGPETDTPTGSLPPKQGFRFYTTIDHGREKGYGHQMVDFGHMTADQLPSLFDSLREQELLDAAEATGDQEIVQAVKKKKKPQRILASIIVARNASPARRKQLADSIIAAIRSKLGEDTEIVLEESFVAPKDEVERLETARAALDEIEATLPPNSLANDVAEIAHRQIQEGIDQAEAFCQSFQDDPTSDVCELESNPSRGVHERRRFSLNPVTMLNNTHPYSVVIAARLIALSKFGISARVVVTKYGFSALNTAIAALYGTVGALFGYNAKAWSDLCQDHEIPLIPQFKPLPGEDGEPRLARWKKMINGLAGMVNVPIALYNGAPFVKSWTLNLVRSIGLAYALRALVFYAGATILEAQTGIRVNVATPWAPAFFFGVIGLALAETASDAVMDTGSKAGEHRGVYNDMSRRYSLWGISFIDTTMHAFFRAGFPLVAWSVAACSWGAKSVVWAAGRLSPGNVRRMVFVDDEVGEVPTHIPGHTEAGTDPRIMAAPKPKTQEGWAGYFWRNTKGFLKYVVGLEAVEQGINWRRGAFDVSDQYMVRQRHALLEDFWNIEMIPYAQGDLTQGEKALINSHRAKTNYSQTEWYRALPQDPIALIKWADAQEAKDLPDELKKSVEPMFGDERELIRSIRETRFASDTDLKPATLKKWLKMGNVKPELFERVWALREQAVRGVDVSNVDLCAAAVAGGAPKVQSPRQAAANLADENDG